MITQTQRNAEMILVQCHETMNYTIIPFAEAKGLTNLHQFIDSDLLHFSQQGLNKKSMPGVKKIIIV